jgi:SAM-dependent methyltransferase
MFHRIRRRLKGALARFQCHPPIGWVRFGSLRRLQPVSRKFGYDRGTPICRYYIETFLNGSQNDIRGRVMEIRNSHYTLKFGGNRVLVRDVLDIDATNPKATFVADLTNADHVPSDLFDCIICTQTLQMIYDVRAAVRHLHRMLKPGGVLLVTTHGNGQLDPDGIYRDHWRFTAVSARKLFAEFFPTDNMEVKSHGNVFALMSSLEGLASQELRNEELDYHDPLYEVIITVRAVKPHSHTSLH